MQIMRLSGPPQHATFYKTAVRAHRRARQLSRRQTTATCGPTIMTVLEQIDHIARTTFMACFAVEVFLIRKGNYEKESSSGRLPRRPQRLRRPAPSWRRPRRRTSERHIVQCTGEPAAVVVGRAWQGAVVGGAVAACSAMLPCALLFPL